MWMKLAVQQGKLKYIKDLKDFTTQSYGFETRINAIKALKELNYLDSETAGNIIKGYFYWNYKLVRVAKDALIYFNQQSKYSKIINKYIRSRKLKNSDIKRLNNIL